MEQILMDNIDRYKDKLLESIVEVVNIPSIKGKSNLNAPFGENVKYVLLKILEIAEGLGFKTKNLDNYIGYAQYGDEEDYIGVLGHLDVVDVEKVGKILLLAVILRIEKYMVEVY